MPLHWTISHTTRLVIAVAKEELRLKDIEAYLDGVVTAGGLSYRKIFDLTGAMGAIDDAEMMALGARIRAYREMGPMGALAIVAKTDASYQRARLFIALAEADRTVKIFRELHKARQWLDGLDSSPGS